MTNAPSLASSLLFIGRNVDSITGMCLFFPGHNDLFNLRILFGRFTHLFCVCVHICLSVHFFLHFRIPREAWVADKSADKWLGTRIRQSVTNSYATAKIYLTLNFEADNKIRWDTTAKVGRRYRTDVCVLSETPWWTASTCKDFVSGSKCWIG